MWLLPVSGFLMGPVIPHHTSAWTPILPCHTRTSAARSGFGEAFKRFIIMGVSLSAGNSPAVMCQEHLCSTPPMAPQPPSSGMHHDPQQLRYFSCSTSPRLPMLHHSHSEGDLLTATAPPVSLLWRWLKKKKERKSMQPRINWTPPFPSPSAPFRKIM